MTTSVRELCPKLSGICVPAVRNHVPPALVTFSRYFAPHDVISRNHLLLERAEQQLMKLGFPVLCIDRLIQIKPAIQTIIHWTPGKLFPEGIGAEVLELEMTTLLSG